MEIKSQWIVFTGRELKQLVLTQQDGYFLQSKGSYKPIGNTEARLLIENTAQGA